MAGITQSPEWYREKALPDVVDGGVRGHCGEDRVVVQDGDGRHRDGTIPSLAMNRRPQLELIAPGASPEQAAAVVAALEQFMRNTTPPPAPAEIRPNPWQQAAFREGVLRAPGPSDLGF